MSRGNKSTRKAKSPSHQLVDAGTTPVKNDTWFFVTCGLIIFAAGLLCWRASNSEIRRAELALSRSEFHEALTLAEVALRSEPTSSRGLVVAGLACVALKNPTAAYQYLTRVSNSDRTLLGIAQRQLGEIAFAAGRVSEAETWLRKAREAAPDDPRVLDQLIYLLTLEGRTWEARNLIFEQFRAGRVNSNYVTLISNRKSSLANAKDFAKRCLSVVPNDLLPNLPVAIDAWQDNQHEKVIELTEAILRKHPGSIDAASLLFNVLVETGDFDKAERVHARLPVTLEDRPDVWVGRGILEEKRGQLKSAVRCFGEALRRDPNITRANLHLAQSLTQLGLPEIAAPFADRANRLAKLQPQLAVNLSELDLGKFRSIVEQLESLGRDWEAAAWCRLILLETGAMPDWARVTEHRLHQALSASNTFTTDAKNPILNLDLSQFPLPSQNKKVVEPSKSVVPAIDLSRSATFRDDAVNCGLSFTYRNGASPGDIETMYEMNGGGVAVLDYDGDHWPDLFFTEGGLLPPNLSDGSRCDQLFRNVSTSATTSSVHATKCFLNVSTEVGINDVGYGQGVAVGDFDNDGFPDLYVGNIGSNQLYRNNGDGTFSDFTSKSGTQAGGWTSSCVFADLNQDGFPDLYVVTYLEGEELAQRTCNKQKHPRCAPLDFQAQQDRLYLNLGDGQFRDVTEASGVVAPDGRGLGVVAADFDGSHRLSLFVGNDMSANFYFRNQTTSQDSIAFQEQALQAGLAFDDQGAAKACMGVAAGDYNGDGRLDLFVTNFYRQFNDLYVQQPDGSFRDLSRKSNLANDSFQMLGWGTQFIDGELDGFPDLILANGHVHEPSDPQVPYRMKPQYYRNFGNERFAEVSSSVLGTFFESEHHGRSLARIDWNRDGREDVCITHLNEPVALLTNQTEPHGTFLAVRLVGVRSSRDPIGATVKVVVGEKTFQRQLIAGDGFQASNERKLIFGLGDAQSIDSLEVNWPTGSTQTFQRIKANQELRIVEEGSHSLFVP